MNIQFLEPTEDDIIQSYEAFRLSDEPDSPQTPYEELSKDRNKHCDSIAKTSFKIISIDDVTIGYSSFMQRNEKIN